MNHSKRYTIAGHIVSTSKDVLILRGLYLDQPHIVRQCDAVLRLMAGG